MDHSLFYKDYSISPIKDTVQVTMNNVGGLLDKIEKLLYDLRESGANYIENAEHLEFQKALENEVAKLLTNHFKVPFKFKDITYVLKFFKGKAGESEDNLTDVFFENLNWSVTDRFCENYLSIRSRNHNLMIIESLFFSWKKLSNKDFDLTQENYESELRIYLKLFIELISSQLNEDPDEIEGLIKHLVEYSKSPQIFLRHLELEKSRKIAKIIDNYLIEDDISRPEREAVIQCFMIVIFDGNISEYLHTITFNLDDMILSVRDRVKGKESTDNQVIYRCATVCLEEIKKIQQE